MKKSLIFDLQAEQEIDDAVSWYESRSEGLGERFLDVLELEEELRILAIAPQKRVPGYWLDRLG